MSFSFVKSKSQSGFGWLSTSLKSSTHSESTLPVFDLIGILLLVSVLVKFRTILNKVLESFRDAASSAS